MGLGVPDDGAAEAARRAEQTAAAERMADLVDRLQAAESRAAALAAELADTQEKAAAPPNGRPGWRWRSARPAVAVADEAHTWAAAAETRADSAESRLTAAEDRAATLAADLASVRAQAAADASRTAAAEAAAGTAGAEAERERQLAADANAERTRLSETLTELSRQLVSLAARPAARSVPSRRRRAPTAPTEAGDV